MNLLGKSAQAYRGLSKSWTALLLCELSGNHLTLPITTLCHRLVVGRSSLHG